MLQLQLLGRNSRRARAGQKYKVSIPHMYMARFVPQLREFSPSALASRCSLESTAHARAQDSSGIVPIVLSLSLHCSTTVVVLRVCQSRLQGHTRRTQLPQPMAYDAFIFVYTCRTRVNNNGFNLNLWFRFTFGRRRPVSRILILLLPTLL